MAWFKDLMLPTKEKLGERAQKVPMRELPSFIAKLAAIIDPKSRPIVPDLGIECRKHNTATCKGLGMVLRSHTESALAMTGRLLRLGLA